MKGGQGFSVFNFAVEVFNLIFWFNWVIISMWNTVYRKSLYISLLVWWTAEQHGSYCNKESPIIPHEQDGQTCIISVVYL